MLPSDPLAVTIWYGPSWITSQWVRVTTCMSYLLPEWLSTYEIDAGLTIESCLFGAWYVLLSTAYRTNERWMKQSLMDRAPVADGSSPVADGWRSRRQDPVADGWSSRSPAGPVGESSVVQEDASDAKIRREKLISWLTWPIQIWE
jgi:hypothetical protein